jgi:hypothetical protein
VNRTGLLSDRDDTLVALMLLVVSALVLQNLLLVAAVAHLALPDLVVVARALTRVALHLAGAESALFALLLLGMMLLAGWNLLSGSRPQRLPGGVAR